MIRAYVRLFPAGLRYMITATFFFSLMSLLVKLSGQRIPPHELVFARSILLLIICRATLKYRGINPWGVQKGLLITRGLFGFVALNCFYYAVVHLPLAEVTVLQFTNPAFTALIAAMVLSERLGSRHMVLVVTSMVGVLLVAQPAALFGGLAGNLEPLGVAAGLCSAFLSACAWVVIRKMGKGEEPLVVVYYFALIATIGSLPAMIASAVMPVGIEWLMLLGIGVFTHFGQLNLTKGFGLEPAGRVAAVGYLQIVFAAVWGVLFFAEVPGLLSIAGTLIIVGSTLLLGGTPAEQPG
jgi:drug/metabolite transporter (DMT)-like permease